ncbi:MAG: hypothetical protein IT250_07815, partial [Chitinophagaceae bacterium]|nr:hypothetical protein [Chitinophagaceae bacterium]
IISTTQRYLGEKMMLNNNNLRLTPAGKLFADGIAAALFEEDKNP